MNRIRSQKNSRSRDIQSSFSPVFRSAKWALNLIFLFALPLLAQSPGAASSVDLKSAESDYRQGRHKNVISRLSQSIDKLDRKGLILLGNAYCGSQNHAAAAKIFTTLLAKDAKDYEAKTLLAREEIHSGKLREALVLLKEAMELNPKFEPAYRLAAEAYEKKDDKYELRLLYQDMIQRLGERPAYITKLCEIHVLDGLYAQAEKYCRQGAKLSPKEAKNYVYLGLISKETGDLKKAQQNLKKAADVFISSDFAQLTYAKFLTEQKNHIDAYGFYQRAARANRNSSMAFIGLGQSAIEIQKYQEALVALEQACKLDKTTAVVALRKAASVLRTMGNSAWLKKYETAIDRCGL